MSKLIKQSFGWAVSISAFVFAIIPEKVFSYFAWWRVNADEVNAILNRTLAMVLIFFLVLIKLLYRKKVKIKGKNYQILIEYGDIFCYKDSKKVITFDECFTTSVGELPHQIKPSSICGQFLGNNALPDVKELIERVNLKPLRSGSNYKKQTRYESGKIVLYEDYLLMAFAKLDKDGVGYMSREEYITSLNVLWEEIDRYYGQKDVCIPIIGSGLTRVDGRNLTQQELLDIIIATYKLSCYKIKNPCKLHIVCKKQEDFSLNRIGEFV